MVTLAANGAPIGANGAALGLPATMTVDVFDRNSGLGAGGPLGWVDAHTTHPDQFDAWDATAGNLVGTPTVRDAWGPTDEGISANYPINPDTLEKYSPWLVSHRLMWADIGIDDGFDVTMSWEVESPPAGVMQVSMCFGVDLAAPNFENGCMYAYDISLGGVSYWHNIPITPDVATCFDPTYYTNMGGSSIMPAFSTGRHWWRIRCQDGTMQAFFDGEPRHTDPVTCPEWTMGRTTVGIHAVVMAVPPDPNLVGPAAVWLPVVTDPLARAVVSSWWKGAHP